MMIFMDGFDYLTVANGGLKWSTMTGSLITGVYGKGKALGGNVSLTQVLATNFVTGFQAFHVFTGTALPGVSALICQFIDAATSQVELRIDNLGQLFFTRNNTSIGSVGTTRLALNQWYFIEVKATINATTGEASCKVNGTAYLTQTGLNTQASANAFFNKLGVTANFSGNQTQAIDSYHFFDTTAGSGNDPSTFFGEHIIDMQLATSDGSNLQWTPNSGTAHFSRVNEANEDGDTSFVSASGANFIDSYNFASLAETTGTIAMVAVNTIDRIDDVGPHTMDHYVLSSGSVSLSAGISPSASYTNHQSFFPLNPNTSAAWTVVNRNTAEFGYKFIS